MKINACHTVGGAEAMVEAVNELCGVQISHYAEVSFDGMQALIDSVGGIDINATDDVDDPEHLDIKITAGQQHMDGATALTYARCRYTYADGDYTRMRHQRQVLGALANQILNNFDATKIFGLVNSLSDMLVTDMSVQDIVATVNAMRGMDVDGIYSANLPSYADDSTMIDGVSYVFVYEDELKEMMERVDAGKDPKGPNTMGLSDGSSSTIGDLNNNTSDDYAHGTATSSVSSDDSDDSSDSAIRLRRAHRRARLRSQLLSYGVLQTRNELDPRRLRRHGLSFKGGFDQNGHWRFFTLLGTWTSLRRWLNLQMLTTPPCSKNRPVLG
ncbi:MAG: LCP family protein [Collinsella sp.]